MTIYTLPNAQAHELFGVEASPQEPSNTFFAEPTLFYDPPYQNEVDDAVAWHLVKYLDSSYGMHYQVPVTKKAQSVRPVDFVIEKDGRRIGLDVFREEDTDPNPLRDALVLGSGMVDVLYQIAADDVPACIHDALFLLTQWDRSLFSERGRINLNVRASDAARETTSTADADARTIRYVQEELMSGEYIPWSEKVLSVARKRPEHAIQDFDAALFWYGLGPDALTHGYVRSA